MKTARLFAALFSFGIATIPCRSATVFEQEPYRGTPFGLISAVGDQRMADNFSPSQDLVVTAVRWHGTFGTSNGAWGPDDSAEPDHRFNIGFHHGTSQ